MGLTASKDEPVDDPLSPEMAHMTKLYEEIVVLPGSIHKLLIAESSYTRSLFLLARHVLQPALCPENRPKLSPAMERVFEVLMKLTHEHLRLANAFSAFSILEYLETDDSDVNGHRLGDLLLLLVPSVTIYMDYTHCFKELPEVPFTPESDPWLSDFLKHRFATPRDLLGLLLLPLQRINQLVDRLREVLIVMPQTYSDFESLRRAFTQHVLLQNMENGDLLKQVAVSGFVCISCGDHVRFRHKRRLPMWDLLASGDDGVHQGSLLCRSNCNTSVWRSMWAVLMPGGHLLFFQEQREVGSEQPMAVLSLHSASLDRLSLPQHPHCIKLGCVERLYYIAFPGESELQQWVLALALEPSDALFECSEQQREPASPRTLRFTPSSVALEAMSEGTDRQWPEILLERGLRGTVLLLEPCTLWQGCPPAPAQGWLYCNHAHLCFVPEEEHQQVCVLKLAEVACLRRSNSGIVNCHAFRVNTQSQELCFASVAHPEDLFLALEHLWHAALQRVWHTVNLLDSDSERDSQQNAIRSLQLLGSDSAHQLLAAQLTTQARLWFQLPSDEVLLQRFGCSLLHKIVFTGHLYLTTNFLCFCSAQYGERVAVVVPLDAVEVEEYDAMMLMPCGIRVTTQIGDYLLGEFSDRELALQALTEHLAARARDSGTDRSFYTNEADTDTAYTCMEESELTYHTDASEHTCRSELSDRSDPCSKPLVSDEEFDSDEATSGPESPLATRELLDECGFAVPEQHRRQFLESLPSDAARAQQRQVWAKHLKLNGSSIELVRTKSLTQLTRFWGIPVQLRSMVWASCCGALNWKYTHPRYYEELMSQEPALSVQEQIKKDLPRSLHSQHKHDGPDSPGQQQLHRVLSAYACHNPALGYCQAMNFLCAFLLVFMEEERAFWTLCCIVEHLLPDYFTYDMLGSLVDCAVFEELIRELCPEIAQLLGDQKFYPGPKWFMGLFLNVLPYTTVARVWDCFLCEGPTALFRVGVALLKLHCHLIGPETDPVDFLQTVEKSAETCYDATEILRVAFDDELSISASRIQDLRARHRVQILGQRQAPVMQRLLDQSRLSQDTLVCLVSGFARLAQQDLASPELFLTEAHWHQLLQECVMHDRQAADQMFEALSECRGEHRLLNWKSFVTSVRSGKVVNLLCSERDVK